MKLCASLNWGGVGGGRGEVQVVTVGTLLLADRSVPVEGERIMIIIMMI